jgi:hypothetical protein
MLSLIIFTHPRSPTARSLGWSNKRSIAATLATLHRDNGSPAWSASHMTVAIAATHGETSEIDPGLVK